MSLSLFPIRPRPADCALKRPLASSRDKLSIWRAAMVVNMDQQSLRGEHMEPVVRHCLLVQSESRKCVVGENEWRVCRVSPHRGDGRNGGSYLGAICREIRKTRRAAVVNLTDERGQPVVKRQTLKSNHPILHPQGGWRVILWEKKTLSPRHPTARSSCSRCCPRRPGRSKSPKRPPTPLSR
jgi:hypothetical protein